MQAQTGVTFLGHVIGLRDPAEQQGTYGKRQQGVLHGSHGGASVWPRSITCADLWLTTAEP